MPDRARAAPGCGGQEWAREQRWYFAPLPLLPGLRGRRVRSVKGRLFYKHLRPFTVPADGTTSFSCSLRPL